MSKKNNPGNLLKIPFIYKSSPSTKSRFCNSSTFTQLSRLQYTCIFKCILNAGTYCGTSIVVQLNCLIHKHNTITVNFLFKKQTPRRWDILLGHVC